MLKARVAVLAVVLPAVASLAAPPAWPPARLPPLREQESVRKEWLRLRLERVLPALMRRYGIPMWIVANREYNEDPVFLSLVSPSTMSARRRTILVFFDRGAEKGVERLALGGGGSGGLYTVVRDPERTSGELLGDAQWALLRRVVDERKPEKIAIDISRTHAFSDGLSAGEREQLEAALGPWTAKLVRAEALPLEYLETRLPEMLPAWRTLQGIAHAVIERAFSSDVITPGRTTTADVEWWMRQTLNDLGLGEWFPPTVDLQRVGRKAEGPIGPRAPVVIERGDVLHCDFGIRAMGLNTDTQHMGYVLREGEADAPESLRTALARSNRLQDLLLARMKPGKTGNEVLAATLAAMKAEGISGSVYSHAIGDHGHGAGPLIGLWDRQEGVPGRGDVPLLANSWFAIELQATTPVPEWNGQEVRSSQEEDAVLGEDGTVRWALDRQTRFHVVR